MMNLHYIQVLILHSIVVLFHAYPYLLNFKTISKSNISAPPSTAPKKRETQKTELVG